MYTCGCSAWTFRIEAAISVQDKPLSMPIAAKISRVTKAFDGVSATCCKIAITQVIPLAGS